MSQPRVRHRYELAPPRPLVVEIHDRTCDCPVCEPYVPSVPPRLDARAVSKLALAGFATGHAIAFAVFGPTTAWHVLVAALLWRPL